MAKVDNGGAIAIRGFNYQKTIVMLIAVLHFLDKDDFELSVETKDDIVFSSTSGNTYIQAKSNELSLSSITLRRNGGKKDSIIEKNLSSGDAKIDAYKLVAPSFKDLDKSLNESVGNVISGGARVYTYNDASVQKIAERLPDLPPDKLSKSKIALTLFSEDQVEALTHIQGVMTSKGISVDYGHGQRSLEELSSQIDRRSAIVANSEEEFAKKKFTKKDLSAIFSHSRKLDHFNNIIENLGYNTARRNALQDTRVCIAALHDSSYSAAKKFIESIDELMDMDDGEVVQRTLNAVSFNITDTAVMREAIVIDAYSQVIYEGKYL